MSTEPSVTQGEKISYAQDRKGQTAKLEQNQNSYAEKDLQIVYKLYKSVITKK